MRLLKDIVKDIKKKQKDIKVDMDRLETMPPSSRNIMLGKARSAKESIKALNKEYEENALMGSILFLTNGANSKEFINISINDFGCFGVNVDDMYEKLVSNVHTSFYMDKPVTSALISIIVDNFSTLGDSLGITSFPMPLYQQKYARRLKDKEDLLELVKQIVNDDIGIEANIMFATNNVIQQAIEEGFVGKTLPMVVYSNDELLNRRIADVFVKHHPNAKVIDTNEEMTSDNVKKILLSNKRKKS